jgi:hypothetical protein
MATGQMVLEPQYQEHRKLRLLDVALNQLLAQPKLLLKA